ncbi:MAG: hypothetical protein Q4P13_04770 [Psychrobacter sp.]|nr:hypothetical protein [Psychrobacter sp.]
MTNNGSMPDANSVIDNEVVTSEAFDGEGIANEELGIDSQALTDVTDINEGVLVVVTLNAKLRPDDQGELEDAFLEYCQESDLPIEIIGGGSLVDDQGESIESVIEMSLTEVDRFAHGIDYLIDHIIGFFEATLAPKGSRLTVYESAEINLEEIEASEPNTIESEAIELSAETNLQSNHSPDTEDEMAVSELAEEPLGRTIYFGHQEGLALYLNGTDLPQKIYQKYHVRQVFDKCDALLKGVGMVNSYWQGYAQTALYMYGDSYSEMVKRIEPVLSRHPLCQKSRLVQIA